ncbi:hypothetical protein NIES22_06660 [Calothrix brevissima NIES-22]|nr:hypothetical protein NIES22_06660 [Calothrix brevissima NIES-22]
MLTAICTLFEGNYHYGVGALTNSLYHHGFRGIIWVGYRGELPPWAQPINKYENYQEYIVADGCAIRFIKLETDYHLTNYKPNFMLSLWQEFCPDAEALFYFDPDIVIKCRWSYFEEWVSYGVALCEDINSPIPHSHPLRMAWRRFYEPHGFNFNLNTDTYVNGGFIGLTKREQDFLDNWLKIQEIMAPKIRGLQNANPGLQKANQSRNINSTFEEVGRHFLFDKTDQDALNIALISTSCPVSLIGKEGMDIIPGGFTMSHALGSIKPWRKQMFLSSLQGKRLTLADKQYWGYTQSPIKLYSNNDFFWKKLDLMCAKIIGRFF